MAVSVVDVPLADILIRALTRQSALTRMAETLCVFVIWQLLALFRKIALTRAIACASGNSAGVADCAAHALKSSTATIVPINRGKNDVLIFIFLTYRLIETVNVKLVCLPQPLLR